MAVIKLMLLACCAYLSTAQDMCPADGCESTDVALLPTTTTISNNHYYIGGMFGIHEAGDNPYECGAIRKRGFLNSEAFFWAIKKYSQLAGLSSPDFSIGGFAMDSCTRTERSIENLYSFETCRTQYTNVSPRNTMAYVGPDSSTEALTTAKLLQEMKRTQVTHSATSPALSDAMHTYFLRTVPNDLVQTKVMVKLLESKQIKYVQVIYSDDAYGSGLLHAFKMNTEEANVDVCVVSEYKIDADLNGLMANLGDAPMTKYVALLANADNSQRVLEAAQANGLGGQFIFLGTSSWGNTKSVIQNADDAAENAITFMLNTDRYYNKNDVDDFYTDFFNLKPNTPTNSGSNVNDYNPAFNEFWEATFGCTLADDTCDLSRDLTDDIERDIYVPYTLMAVDAIIRGVKISSQKYCSGDHLCSDLLNLESRGEKLYEGILQASQSNQRFFQANGDAATAFDKYKILQVRNNAYVEVQEYSQSTGFQLVNGQVDLIMYSSQCPNSPCIECGEAPATTPPVTTAATTSQGPEQVTIDPAVAMALLIAQYFEKDQEFTGIWRDQPREDDDWKTRFENSQDWIIALGVLAGLGIVCVLIFEIYILYKLMGTKIGKQWRTMWLGQLLLFALFLSYLVLFAYLFTPTKATCGITRFGVGVCYAMCFAVLLVKLMVLLTSKTTADTLIPGDVDSPNYLRGIYQFLMFIFVVGVQIVIAIQWLIHVPPEAVQVASNNGDLVWICNHYTWSLDNSWDNMTMFVRTEFENHLISLSYVMVLILITTIVAMKAHGIITNHRESVFIGLAAGFTIPVWVAWGLVGGLNKDHEYAQEFGDACLAFGLLITATIILFAMFLPKVRQLVNMGVEGIYLEDDRDTYYAGSVIMAPPSYKSRPSSVVYVNNNGYSDPVMIGGPDAVHLKHPGSNYSAPVYVKRPDSTIGGSGKVLRMTGDLTGKHPRESRKAASEMHYGYAGSGYGGTKPRSEGGTIRRAHSTQNLGAL